MTTEDYWSLSDVLLKKKKKRETEKNYWTNVKSREHTQTQFSVNQIFYHSHKKLLQSCLSKGLYGVVHSVQGTGHTTRMVAGLMDFNYSRSLEELGQYALDKSRLRVDLMYLGSLKKGEIRGYSTEAFKFVKYKNKEVEMEPLCQTKTKGIWRKFLYGETTLSGTH